VGYVGNNSGRGRFKYICFSCKTEQFIQMSKFANRTMPRCCSCGSTSLDPIHERAAERVKAGNARQLLHREKLRP